VHQAVIDRDAGYPGGELCLTSKLVDFREYLQKTLLNDVLSILGIADDLRNCSLESSAMRSDE
jgi:hypothetical protein